jgi:hypothetical protein
MIHSPLEHDGTRTRAVNRARGRLVRSTVRKVGALCSGRRRPAAGAPPMGFITWHVREDVFFRGRESNVLFRRGRWRDRPGRQAVFRHTTNAAAQQAKHGHTDENHNY